MARLLHSRSWPSAGQRSSSCDLTISQNQPSLTGSYPHSWGKNKTQEIQRFRNWYVQGAERIVSCSEQLCPFRTDWWEWWRGSARRGRLQVVMSPGVEHDLNGLHCSSGHYRQLLEIPIHNAQTKSDISSCFVSPVFVGRAFSCPGYQFQISIDRTFPRVNCY